MIIDTLENLPLYAHLNPRFQKVIDFLSENDINQLPEGKHLIDGEDVFVNIQMATGKAPDVAVLETHRKMIDIQIPLSAPETYGYTPTVDLPELEYNEQKDITKYPDILAQSTRSLHLHRQGIQKGYLQSEMLKKLHNKSWKIKKKRKR